VVLAAVCRFLPSTREYFLGGTRVPSDR
jgi:hypothetical protein